METIRNLIEPLRGWRYDPARVDLAKAVAPPYDVIGEADQIELYGRDPHNIVRVILGRQFPEDVPTQNRYTRAAEHLREWRREGALRQDAPALYLYEQEFAAFARDGGPVHVRRGVLARVRLSEWGRDGIYPHEKTLAGPKADRLELMRATHADTEPIFGLVADPGGRFSTLLSGLARRDAFAFDIPESDGCRNRLAVLDDPESLRRFEPFAANAVIYIADGHHRYETALAYRDEIRARRFPAGVAQPPHGALDCDYILMLLVPDSDPGLVIHPTHRRVRDVSGFDAGRLLDGCRRFFDIESFADADRLLAGLDEVPEPAFGLALPDGLRRLRLKDPGAMARRLPAAAPAVRDLDVSVLHTLILEDLLGVDEAKLLAKENIDYTKSADEAMRAARLGDGGTQCAFLLRATRMDQLRAVADAGGVMPQKSTYFYPKALSGLVLNLFETE